MISITGRKAFIRLIKEDMDILLLLILGIIPVCYSIFLILNDLGWIVR